MALMLSDVDTLVTLGGVRSFGYMFLLLVADTTYIG